MTDEIVKALHESVVAEGLTFPCHVTLDVAGTVHDGYVYEDGHFTEGEPEANHQEGEGEAEQDADADDEGEDA